MNNQTFHVHLYYKLRSCKSTIKCPKKTLSNVTLKFVDKHKIILK